MQTKCNISYILSKFAQFWELARDITENYRNEISYN